MRGTNILKIFGVLMALALLVGLIPLVAGCSSEAATATVTATATATTTATATITATPTPEPSPTGFPLATKKTRFRIATTTSLYDTGLWYYLEPLFEEYANVEMDIVYAGTGAALNQAKAGNVDAVAVHDPDQEKPFVDEGWIMNKRSFAYNFFMIAGPADDPAGIKGLAPGDAFKKLAEAGMADPENIKFVSRGDSSGTHGAEQRMWAGQGYDYATEIEGQPWYVESGQGMAPTLTMANELNAYVLCDGSTFVFAKSNISLVSLVQGATEVTLNIYNIYAVNPEKVKSAKLSIANQFINWLISDEIQAIIGEYGVAEFGGSLFNPITDGGCTYSACPDPVENLKPVE
jgi:tungstate transport system substrate-binding protein